MKDHRKMSKAELLKRISQLELLNKQLLTERQQEDRLEYAWSGNLGHWYWDIKNNIVTFNPLKVITLGYSEDEVPNSVNYQFFTELLHPDDYPIAMQAMKDHLYHKKPVYETEYRIKTRSGDYRWYYDRGRITQYDDDNKPIFMAGIVFDITERKLMEQDLASKNKILAKLSTMDGLTKISNHKTLVDFVKEEMSISTKTDQPLSIVMFDIDDFKKVNDTKGHVFGDKVLIRVAEILKRAIRDKDLVGRYGGEEFMLVLPKTDLEQAKIVAERIRKAVEVDKMIDDQKITISGGVKQFANESITDFIHDADQALYKAKKNGKNRIEH
ncbi:MAG: sensor domain-containing diguanylate cyclase [Erysipelotrichaceae bacterium]|nr:sensor domain-containing diguanylate cyclase [Erysipelotrichaceae bacterium]MDD3924280.1 sensor domain-containing diguanylate cyclase [Erysipelotrichaceae bacterium]MDD4643356.1 sensor domain-containing diguanylate cyclase [Erysipelotrichaceae bacterium]